MPDNNTASFQLPTKIATFRAGSSARSASARVSVRNLIRANVTTADLADVRKAKEQNPQAEEGSGMVFVEMDEKTGLYLCREDLVTYVCYVLEKAFCGHELVYVSPLEPDVMHP